MVNRVINVAFRAIPMRIGVDQVSAAWLAPALGLNPAIGLTLALVGRAACSLGRTDRIGDSEGRRGKMS